jgi:hypothetical protein
MHPGARWRRPRRATDIPEICRAVDAGNDNIGNRIKQAGQRQIDTITRRTGNPIAAIIKAFDTNGLIQGQRVAGAGAVPIRSNHDNFTNRSQMAREHEDTGRFDPIVIADQDTHFLLPAKWIELRGQCATRYSQQSKPVGMANHTGITRCPE